MDSSPKTADQVLSLILSSAYTRADAFEALNVIRAYIESHVFTTSKQSSLSTAQIKRWDACIQGMTSLSSDITPTTLYPTIEHVEKALEGLPVVSLYVPTTLESSDTHRIGLWARTEIHPQVLITFIIDQSYIGGCGISWNGTLKDYSMTVMENQQRDVIQHMLHPEKTYESQANTTRD